MNNEFEHDIDRLLVAEYALGLLDTKEAQVIEKRLRENPQLRSEYVFWSEQLALLMAELPQDTPSAQVKIAINKRLFGQLDNNRKDSSWWALFTGKKVASMALAIVLTFGVFYLLPKPFTPDYTAVLQTQDESLLITAEYDAQKNLLRMRSSKGESAQNRDIELWLIAADQIPVSLGVITMTKTHEIMLPEALSKNIIGATLALSDEPVGGSPTGQPTGTILATATVQAT